MCVCVCVCACVRVCVRVCAILIECMVHYALIVNPVGTYVLITCILH